MNILSKLNEFFASILVALLGPILLILDKLTQGETQDETAARTYKFLLVVFFLTTVCPLLTVWLEWGTYYRGLGLGLFIASLYTIFKLFRRFRSGT